MVCLAPYPRPASRRPPLPPMLPSALLAAAAVALLAGSVNGQESWTYLQHGNDWEGQCRNGRFQSPVNIETDQVTKLYKDQPLQFFNYHKLIPVKVEVDAPHYTVKVIPDPSAQLAIEGGGLPGRYRLDSLHFHWPAEHTVNDKRSILEAHFVHVKDVYNSTTQAVGDPEGIAVLGVLFMESKENLELIKIEVGAKEGESLLFMDRLLPYDKHEFYRYSGSLTTPTCNEAVIWTIFKHHVPASPLQVAAFRGLLPEKDQTIDTYRNLQPLNGRSIELWSTSYTGLNKVHKTNKKLYSMSNPGIRAFPFLEVTSISNPFLNLQPSHLQYTDMNAMDLSTFVSLLSFIPVSGSSIPAILLKRTHSQLIGYNQPRFLLAI